MVLCVGLVTDSQVTVLCVGLVTDSQVTVQCGLVTDNQVTVQCMGLVTDNQVMVQCVGLVTDNQITVQCMGLVTDNQVTVQCVGLVTDSQVARYRDEILRPHVIPFLQQHNLTLQQDNARPHVAGICQVFLANNNIQPLNWQPYSPDLSPIEHLWDQF